MKALSILIPAVTLAVGLGIGVSTSATAEPVVKTKTVTETVEVTPQSCLDALDHADRGFNIAADGFEAAEDGFNAVAEFDVAALEAVVPRITTTADEMSALVPQYQSAKADCRAS